MAHVDQSVVDREAERFAIAAFAEAGDRCQKLGVGLAVASAVLALDRVKRTDPFEAVKNVFRKSELADRLLARDAATTDQLLRSRQQRVFKLQPRLNLVGFV